MKGDCILKTTILLYKQRKTGKTTFKRPKTCVPDIHEKIMVIAKNLGAESDIGVKCLFPEQMFINFINAFILYSYMSLANSL